MIELEKIDGIEIGDDVQLRETRYIKGEVEGIIKHEERDDVRVKVKHRNGTSALYKPHELETL